MSDDPSPQVSGRSEDRRLHRITSRTTDHARRIAASLAAMGSIRYPGGVDPIVLANDEADVTVVTGWARTTGSPLTCVVVMVDGAPVAIGQRHPDDIRRSPAIAPWRAEVALPNDRSFQLAAVAVFANGLTQRLDQQIIVATVATLSVADAAAAAAPTTSDRGPQGYLEVPATGSVVDASLVTVAGWTVVDPIARIEVTVDGEITSARQMAIPRRDVAAQQSSAHAGFCGFEEIIDLTGHAEGDVVTILTEAVTFDGTRQNIGTTEVTIGETPTPPPADEERVATLRSRTDRVVKMYRRTPTGVRILAITHDLGLGGGQLYLQELLVRLLESPDVGCVLVSPSDGPLRDELEALGVEVHITGPFPTDPAAHEELIRELAFLAAEQETTVVIVNTAGAAAGVDLATRIGVPALWAIHESYAPEQYMIAAYSPGGAHASAERRLSEALASAAAVIFEAKATRELYCSYGDPRRFLHVGYGIPLPAIDDFLAGDNRDERRAELGWTDDDRVLLCVGTLEPRKAQASLLRAFERVSADHPEAVLVLVGDRGDFYGDELRTYADRLNLDDRVRIEPVSPDCYGWYAMADAFVLASDIESLPRSVLEAMAFGLPAIVADVFGLSDLIDDGDTGLLITPRDLASLEAGIRRFLTMSHDEQLALGARGAAHIRAEYDSRSYAQVYRKLIDGLASDPRALPEAILGQ